MYSEIAVIVNPLTYKSRSWAPYMRSNIHKTNHFKAITFRQTDAGLTETQEKRKRMDMKKYTYFHISNTFIYKQIHAFSLHASLS